MQMITLPGLFLVVIYLVEVDEWVSDQGDQFWKVRFQEDQAGDIGKLYWLHGMGIAPVEYVKSAP